MTNIPGIDYIGITFTFFCHDGNGRFVMALRGKNARDEQGRWDLGGGQLEFGEDAIASLKREIKEEYCADVLEHEFLGYRSVLREQKGKQTHWLSLDYLVRIDPTQVANGEPHKLDAVEWFTLDTLPSPTHSQCPNFLKAYKEKLTKCI
ncbi:MAG: NUDIX domain-containing protein [Candidatus Pacebacteria bacterium]|nr:NUDIX domain-containing protein [Candidatus Paceibacterota bacterium]